jgi:hypothetical protein
VAVLTPSPCFLQAEPGSDAEAVRFRGGAVAVRRGRSGSMEQLESAAREALSVERSSFIAASFCARRSDWDRAGGSSC